MLIVVHPTEEVGDLHLSKYEWQCKELRGQVVVMVCATLGRLCTHTPTTLTALCPFPNGPQGEC